MCVSRLSSLGGPERTRYEEAVEVKPGLCWRPQDAGEARVTDYLLRRAAAQVDVRASPREKSILRSVKRRGVGDLQSAQHQDIKMQFAVCSDGFTYCFGPVFPHYAPLPHFWHINV